ncbi:hypothetical protein SLEP1_g51657 [Rubroshorea leprosula]|uniref:Disease resistance protein At4g27190-like leucine-rich repeats domain-containing protein n=1 Tax=Rubroshorea leprosula TaxID=152421 RepID=A0AAV5M5E1_9ROSI|nr:hypothetical protein SLEP1_g51657 [Rubroshorea leprosula]
MVRFNFKFSSEQEKETTDGRSEELLVKKEPNIFIEVFFCDEVELPILKKLTLSSINTKQIWNSHLSSISSFAQNLTKLKVVNCSNLKYLFTFSMLKSFAQLEELGVSGCEMMEVVILIEGTVEEEKICQTAVFPKLETLILNDLPQLATSCSNCDSLGKFSEFERVNFDTRSQKLLATQSTLVEIEATELVFSRVTELILRLLPKFKSFFPQTHITEWPSLEGLVVIDCHGAQIVASEFSRTEMTHRDSQLERESQHLMFWISKATFPSLERLFVKWNDNMKIQCGHHPEEYFGKLEVLHLIGFPNQSAFLPPFFFHSLPNLESLLVKDAFFDELFQCEEVTRDCNFKFPALVEVIVTECPNMQIFSKGELSTPRLYTVKLTGDIDEDMDGGIDVDIEKFIVDHFHKDDDEDEAGKEDEVEDERSWEGNLNSTIQQLFKEKSARNCKDDNGENSDHDAKETDGN